VIMGKLQDFLTGTKVLEEVESPINGKIAVTRSLAFGTYISVGGLTQSGGVLKNIWKKTLKKVHSSPFIVHRCLILGLGGGTAGKLVNEFWPEAKITGVDLDPVMVELGRKYLKLDEIGIDVVIGDAWDYVRVNSKSNSKRKYDLVLVDLYVGDNFPEKFESPEFIKIAGSYLADGGIAVFNRLYYGEKRREATRFLKTLEKVFKKVDVVYPEANIMFLCKN